MAVASLITGYHSSSAGLPALPQHTRRSSGLFPVTSPGLCYGRCRVSADCCHRCPAVQCPNRPEFTPVTFRWPGRAASSVPLKVRVAIPTAVAWQFSAWWQNDSVGERPERIPKSHWTRGFWRRHVFFRLSPDTWQGLSSRLPWMPIWGQPARQTVRQNSKRAPVLFIITFLILIFYAQTQHGRIAPASEYSPSCVALLPPGRPASPPPPVRMAQ